MPCYKTSKRQTNPVMKASAVCVNSMSSTESARESWWPGAVCSCVLSIISGSAQVTGDALVLLSRLLHATHPEVRAAAVFALGICVQVGATT